MLLDEVPAFEEFKFSQLRISKNHIHSEREEQGWLEPQLLSSCVTTMLSCGHSCPGVEQAWTPTRVCSCFLISEPLFPRTLFSVNGVLLGLASPNRLFTWISHPDSHVESLPYDTYGLLILEST